VHCMGIKNTTPRSGGAMVWWSCSCQCILAIPLSSVVVPKLLVGCQVRPLLTKLSLTPIRRIGSMSWHKKESRQEEERIDAATNCKAVAEASAQLVQAFQQFPPHLLSLRMWE